jgi:trans-aconitate methyltransferase
MTTDYKLGLAPIKSNPSHVIDFGTGTGIWCIDFAEEYPDSQVIGVDLSPQQPDFVPPNCKFEIDDLEEPWTWSTQFDYIHTRMMASSIADVPKFFRKCYQNTAPGGWIEMQDTHFPLLSQDGSLHAGTALHEWCHKMVTGLKMFQREIETPNYQKYMEDAGYVDVKEVQYVWPSNAWPKDKKLKEMGRWNLVNMLDGLEGYSMALFTRAHGMSPEEVQVFLADVRKDMKNPKIHSYWPM